MAIDLANGWLRYDSASASCLYYGYNTNLGAADTDSTWSIRQVSSANNVQTVKWTNNSTPGASTWANRTQSFSTPGGSLGLTYSKTGSSGNYYVNFSWTAIKGADYYLFSAINGSGNVVSNSGALIQGQYVTSTFSNTGYNYTSYNQQVMDTNATYSFTVVAQNIAGSIGQTVNIYFS
jgi:hypothetical protein